MSNLRGATYKSWSGSSIGLNTVFQLINMGVTTDTPLTGLLSDNDGTLQNDSGAPAELNGRGFLLGTLSGGVNVEFVVAISSDKITWVPLGGNFYDVAGGISSSEQLARIFDYKISVPDQYYVGLLARTVSGTSTLVSNSVVHEVWSDEGYVTEPKIHAMCSTIYDNAFLDQTINGNSNFEKVVAVTSDFANNVGVLSDNLGRFTNDTGETLTSSGLFVGVHSGGFAAISITYRMRPYKNGVAPPAHFVESRASMVQGENNIVFAWYWDDFNDGDYVEYWAANTSGGLANMRIWSLQHFMRSHT